MYRMQLLSADRNLTAIHVPERHSDLTCQILPGTLDHASNPVSPAWGHQGNSPEGGRMSKQKAQAPALRRPKYRLHVFGRRISELGRGYT